MTAPNPKEALEECIAVLQLVEQPAIRDPDHREEVGALGDRIGFGALMSAASAEWRERLLQEGALVGGEFVAGPCRATVLEALAKARAALATKPDGERREEIARIIKAHVDYFLSDEEGPVKAADLILAIVQNEAGWRDISTAPKNHFPVLTWSERGGRCVAFLDATWTWWPCPATEPLINNPTHWMPLPAPPIRSARDGGAET